MNHPTLDQWKRGLAIAEQIAALEKELTAILGGKSPVAAPAAKAAGAPAGRKKGKMSAAGRARIVAAQKARWAKPRSGGEAPADKNSANDKVENDKVENDKVANGKVANGKVAKAPAKKKRSMSPEVKARLAAAMKARWADAKAGKAPAPNAKGK